MTDGWFMLVYVELNPCENFPSAHLKAEKMTKIYFPLNNTGAILSRVKLRLYSSQPGNVKRNCCILHLTHLKVRDYKIHVPGIKSLESKPILVNIDYRLKMNRTTQVRD